MSNSIESIVKHLIKLNNHNMNISLPAIVVNTDSLVDGFIDVKPIVNHKNPLTSETLKYPTIRGVSVMFPSTNTSSITFPVSQGDTVLLVFQSVSIESFVNGNTKQHDPDFLTTGNMKDVVAMVGFTPHQKSPFNSSNYKGEFDLTDLNICHNINTDSEIIFKLTSGGDLKVLNAKKVSYECEEFEVNASEKIKFTAPLISENGR